MAGKDNTMNIKLFPYAESREVITYDFAKRVRIIEMGNTYEIVTQSDNLVWYSTSEYTIEIVSE